MAPCNVKRGIAKKLQYSCALRPFWIIFSRDRISSSGGNVALKKIVSLNFFIFGEVLIMAHFNLVRTDTMRNNDLHPVSSGK